MGQQQLLLILLGLILVGIAITLGLGMFSSGSQSSSKNAVVSDLINLASNSQSWYRKPRMMGGGGNSFINYTIPNQLQSTVNGRFSIKTPGTNSSIVLAGAPADLTDTWHYESTVYKDSVVIVSR